jgi:hypothetical protein
VNRTFYVPVRANRAGVLTLRTGQLESGERIGLAFTSQYRLSFTLGPAQQWVNLGENSLRDMLAPLGIRQLRIDPLPLGGPGAPELPRQARRRIVPHAYRPAAVTHSATWAMAFRSLSGHHRDRHSPWPARGRHKAKVMTTTI